VANPSKVEQRRLQFTPLIATAFIELGYRGTTTAQLAERCSVRENVLYRIWPTKKAMFLDAVEHVYRATMQAWDVVIADASRGKTVAERILNNQADYHGRMRLYRILLLRRLGLSLDDVAQALGDRDWDVRAAMANHLDHLDTRPLGPGKLTRDGDGRVVHGELHAGDGVVWLHPESAKWKLASPRSVGAATGMTAVMVDDVDAHYRHAKEQGAAIDYEPMDQPYGYREYSARDSEGGMWSFMKPLPCETHSD